MGGVDGNNIYPLICLLPKNLKKKNHNIYSIKNY